MTVSKTGPLHRDPMRRRFKPMQALRAARWRSVIEAVLLVLVGVFYRSRGLEVEASRKPLICMIFALMAQNLLKTIVSALEITSAYVVKSAIQTASSSHLILSGAIMKSVVQFTAAVVAGLVASMGSAAANFGVPEPSTLPLVGVAVVGALVVARFMKK